MRTIKELVSQEKRVYIFLRNAELQDRFMHDAEREGITFGDGVKPTERKADDKMALQADGTICFLGFAGRMSYHYSKNTVIRIDYEKYIAGAEDYTIPNKE